MFYSNKNDYHLINSVDYKYMSEPTRQFRNRNRDEYEMLKRVVQSAPIENPIGLNVFGKDQERHKERAEAALAKGFDDKKKVFYN